MTGLEELYRRHAQDVFRFALWLSGERAEAEDITSETFVRAWAGADDLRMSTVRAYLITIARNVFLQRLRRARRQAELDPDQPDPGPGPERQVDARDELQGVLRRMQRLSEADRAALLMHAELGMSYEDIARALGVSVTALKVRVHRARIKLAQLRHEEGAER